MNPHPIRLGMFALALLLTSTLPAPAQAQTSARVQSAAPPPEAVSDLRHRALEPADLLPHLDQIRREHPRLYDRLRRLPPPTAEAMAARPPRSVEGLLRQDVAAALRKSPAEPERAP